MKLWISKNSEVPIHEQLVTQIILGIVSNDLKTKQRLPSTRDLARRYDIHANTVSAAYRELSRRGWVEFRKGSGVYVKTQRPETTNDRLALDQLIGRFFNSLREDGHALSDIQAAVRRSFSVQRPDHFLLLEADAELRSILVAEIAEATGVQVKGAGPEDLTNASLLIAAVPVVLYGHSDEFETLVESQPELLLLHSASVAESFQGQTRPPADALIAVVSRWPEFLRWSRTMLVAAGIDGDALSLRDARERGWEKGLQSAAFVITDSLMAQRIPKGCEVKVFRVIAASSLKEIKEYAEKFF
jgi:DNA-binding transcriptional regulator YhcF (GntR family)